LTALVRTRPVVIQRFDPSAVRGASNAYRLGPFPGLKAFGRIDATRVIDGKTETDVPIFVLSHVAEGITGNGS
jgi:hypothetical protein